MVWIIHIKIVKMLVYANNHVAINIIRMKREVMFVHNHIYVIIMIFISLEVQHKHNYVWNNVIIMVLIHIYIKIIIIMDPLMIINVVLHNIVNIVINNIRL